MESKVNYTIVGIFVVVLLAATIFTSIWLSAGISKKTYAVYQVNMNEPVTGLSIDASVKLNGVDVGNVKNIKLNPTNPKQVELLLNIEDKTPITEDTTATLKTLGITGVTYIGLTTQGINNIPLTAKFGQKYPIIRTKPSLLVRVDTAVSDINDNFDKISGSLQATLDAENRQAFKEILANLNQITKTLADNNKMFTKIMQNSALASKQFPQMMSNAQTTFQIMNTQTLPTMNQMLVNLNTVASNTAQLTENIKQNPAVILRGQQPAPLGPGEH